MNSFKAMQFACTVHKDQRRKYTGNPYADHLAEVAGIVSTVDSSDRAISVAWLHDCIEDQNVPYDHLFNLFGEEIAEGVIWLTDDPLSFGNREVRKLGDRMRLSEAPDWIQTIKCADIISNASSIMERDPKFAVTYIKEIQMLLEVLTKADKQLWQMAYSIVL